MASAPKLELVPHSQSAPLRPDDILTPEQLAERLKLPLSWVYKKSALRGPKNIPVLRCGRYLRFDWNAVCEWLRSNNST